MSEFARWSQRERQVRQSRCSGKSNERRLHRQRMPGRVPRLGQDVTKFETTYMRACSPHGLRDYFEKLAIAFDSSSNESKTVESFVITSRSFSRLVGLTSFNLPPCFATVEYACTSSPRPALSMYETLDRFTSKYFCPCCSTLRTLSRSCSDPSLRVTFPDTSRIVTLPTPRSETVMVTPFGPPGRRTSD